LINADLTGAHLFGAYLTGTDLTQANLNAADLTHAHLRYADLKQLDVACGSDVELPEGLTLSHVRRKVRAETARRLRSSRSI
jgi:uncharacterized protein YjbI with pentapeptide repeats